MKILFLTPRLPFPPYRGDKLRIYNFITTLAKDNEITLVSFYENLYERRHKKELEKYCAKIYLIYLPKWYSFVKAILFYLFPEPSQCYYYRSLRMANLISRLAKHTKYDFAYIHLFRMYHYAKYLPKNIYQITDLTDVVSKEMFRSIGRGFGLKAMILKREAMKIRNYERGIVQTAQEIWVVSENEKNDLLIAGREGNIHIVKIGVRAIASERKVTEHSILFFGYSTTSHNLAALNFLRNKIMPEIVKIIPDIKLNVFGAGNWPKQKQRAGAFPIRYFGFVKDPTELFETNSVMVAPILYSAGTQTKILDAMNNSIPVITSSFGNEGIQARNGLEIMICNYLEEYVEAIRRLVMDAEYNKYIGNNGQKYVRANFLWTDVIDRVKVLEKTLKSQNLKP